MRRLFALFFLLALISMTACSSTQPESVIVDAPLATATTTPIPSITPTEPPTMTPSSTPDLRVINIDPRLIILTEEEIDEYYDYGMYGSVPNYREYGNIINPYANLACSIGTDKAVEFLDQTGLVTGWTTQYIRAKKSDPIPSHVEFSVMTFDSVSGPGDFMNEWNYSCEYNFYIYEQDLEFGDFSTLCSNHVIGKVNDIPTVIEQYRLAIRFKNLYLGMKATGIEGKNNLESLYQLAEIQMDKMANLPLVNVVRLDVDFTPGVGCVKPPTPEGGNAGDSSLQMGYCIAKRVDGTKVCWGPCLLECSGITPEGEIVGSDGCIPCAFVEGPSIGSSPPGTMETVEKKSQ